MPRCSDKNHAYRKTIEPNAELGDIIEICTCTYSPNVAATFALTLGSIATAGFGLLVVGGVSIAHGGIGWFSDHDLKKTYEYKEQAYNTLDQAREARKREQEKREQENARSYSNTGLGFFKNILDAGEQQQVVIIINNDRQDEQEKDLTFNKTYGV